MVGGGQRFPNFVPLFCSAMIDFGVMGRGFGTQGAVDRFCRPNSLGSNSTRVKLCWSMSVMGEKSPLSRTRATWQWSRPAVVSEKQARKQGSGSVLYIDHPEGCAGARMPCAKSLRW